MSLMKVRLTCTVGWLRPQRNFFNGLVAAMTLSGSFQNLSGQQGNQKSNKVSHFKSPTVHLFLDDWALSGLLCNYITIQAPISQKHRNAKFIVRSNG